MEKSNEIVLSVKDFQIVKNASLTFRPGLNAIIGQSNNGKTALFRAAKACIYNEPGTTSVRNGCSYYAVGIQMNGHTVICQKGQSNIYKIDGTLFQKIGRTQLPEVAGALGIRELNLNGSNEQINFWDQMEKPFLLDRSETELFRFIVDSGKDNNITQALKSIVSDRQNISKEITMTEGMIAQSETTIKSYEDKLVNSDDTLKLCDKIIQLGPEIKRLNDIKLKSDELDNIIKSLDIVNESLNAKEEVLLRVEDKANKLSSNIKLRSVLLDRVSTYDSRKEIYTTLNNRVNSINALEASKINEMFNKYNVIKSVVSNHEEASGEFERCSKLKVPELSEDFIKSYEQYTKLRDVIKRIDNNILGKNNSDSLVQATSAKLNELKKELDDIGICPTCGQPIHS